MSEDKGAEWADKMEAQIVQVVDRAHAAFLAEFGGEMAALTGERGFVMMCASARLAGVMIATADSIRDKFASVDDVSSLDDLCENELETGRTALRHSVLVVPNEPQ